MTNKIKIKYFDARYIIQTNQETIPSCENKSLVIGAILFIFGFIGSILVIAVLVDDSNLFKLLSVLNGIFWAIVVTMLDHKRNMYLIQKYNLK